MILLSIIVPVYNVEKYIVECINSLLAQKTSEVEIILVNDGSKDHSVQLIKSQFESELQSGELILLEQMNQGVSVARNTGIQCANGEYIGFVDADDLVLPNYFVYVLDAVSTVKPDIVEIGWKTFVNHSDLAKSDDFYVHSNFGLHPVKSIINDVFSASIWYPVIRFFRRELFSGHLFPAGVRFCEDMMVLHAIYNQAKTIYHIEKALYAYRMNPQGATRNVTKKYVDDLIIFYEDIISYNNSHYRLMKVNLFYLLFRCSDEAKIQLNLPRHIQRDLNRIKWQLWLSQELGVRKFIIFLFPKLFLIWINLKRSKLAK